MYYMCAYYWYYNVVQLPRYKYRGVHYLLVVKWKMEVALL